MYAGSVKLKVYGSSFRSLVWYSDTVPISQMFTSACYWAFDFVTEDMSLLNQLKIMQVF